MQHDKHMNESTIKTNEREVGRKNKRNVTVENETVDSLSDLITVLKYYAINMVSIIEWLSV